MNKLFFICICFLLASKFIQEEVRLLIALGYILYSMLLDRRAVISAFGLFINFFIVLIIGSVQGLGNNISDYSRDIFLILQIVVYFILGMYLFKHIKSWDEFFLLILGLGLTSALYHLHFFLLDSSVLDLPLDQMRLLVGRGSSAEVLAYSLALLCIIKRKTRHFFHIRLNYIFWTVFILLTISFALYLSRSMIISLFICVLCLLGVIDINDRRSNIRALAILSVSIFVLMIFPSKVGQGSELLNKIGNTKEELFSERVSAFSESDINDNWRRYETYRGMFFFEKAGIFEKILGSGCGTLVDLGISIKLGSENEFQKIPVFHNGYVYLLVKFGFFGVIVYIFLLYSLSIKKKIKTENFGCRTSKRLIEAICIITLINTYTISGLLNKEAFLYTIFLGFLWRILSKDFNHLTN